MVWMDGDCHVAVCGTCIALTEDATEVIVGTREGLVIVWNVESVNHSPLIFRNDSTATEHTQQTETAIRLPRLILPGLPAKGWIWSGS